MCHTARLSARLPIVKRRFCPICFWAGVDSQVMEACETEKMCRPGNVSALHHMSYFLFLFYAAKDKKKTAFGQGQKKARLKV